MRRSSVLLSVPFAVVLGLVVAGRGGPITLAQDATPAAGGAQFPLSPDPADCQGEPRAADDLLALWFGPDGSPVAAAADEPAPTDVTIPLGIPADEATVAAITDVVVGVFSCFAAGDFLRATALFSDDLAASFGPELGVSEADARAFLEAPPEPETEGTTQLLAITDVMDLDDGRVGAFVVEHAEGDPPLTSYAIFVDGDDGWLVDEVVEFSTPAFEEDEDGTPVP